MSPLAEPKDTSNSLDLSGQRNSCTVHLRQSDVLISKTNSSPAPESQTLPLPKSTQGLDSQHPQTYSLCSKHGVALLELWEDVSWRKGTVTCTSSHGLW